MDGERPAQKRKGGEQFSLHAIVYMCRNSFRVLARVKKKEGGCIILCLVITRKQSRGNSSPRLRQLARVYITKILRMNIFRVKSWPVRLRKIIYTK